MINDILTAIRTEYTKIEKKKELEKLILLYKRYLLSNKNIISKKIGTKSIINKKSNINKKNILSKKSIGNNKNMGNKKNIASKKSIGNNKTKIMLKRRADEIVNKFVAQRLGKKHHIDFDENLRGNMKSIDITEDTGFDCTKIDAKNITINKTNIKKDDIKKNLKKDEVNNIVDKKEGNILNEENKNVKAKNINKRDVGKKTITIKNKKNINKIVNKKNINKRNKEIIENDINEENEFKNYELINNSVLKKNEITENKIHETSKVDIMKAIKIDLKPTVNEIINKSRKREEMLYLPQKKEEIQRNEEIQKNEEILKQRGRPRKAALPAPTEKKPKRMTAILADRALKRSEEIDRILKTTNITRLKKVNRRKKRPLNMVTRKRVKKNDKEIGNEKEIINEKENVDFVIEDSKKIVKDEMIFENENIPKEVKIDINEEYHISPTIFKKDEIIRCEDEKEDDKKEELTKYSENKEIKIDDFSIMKTEDFHFDNQKIIKDSLDIIKIPKLKESQSQKINFYEDLIHQSPENVFKAKEPCSELTFENKKLYDLFLNIKNEIKQKKEENQNNALGENLSNDDMINKGHDDMINKGHDDVIPEIKLGKEHSHKNEFINKNELQQNNNMNQNTNQNTNQNINKNIKEKIDLNLKGQKDKVDNNTREENNNLNQNIKGQKKEIEILIPKETLLFDKNEYSKVGDLNPTKLPMINRKDLLRKVMQENIKKAPNIAVLDPNNYESKIDIPNIDIDGSLERNYRPKSWTLDIRINQIVKDQNHSKLDDIFGIKDGLDLMKIFPNQNVTNESPNKWPIQRH